VICEYFDSLSSSAPRDRPAPDLPFQGKASAGRLLAAAGWCHHRSPIRHSENKPSTARCIATVEPIRHSYPRETVKSSAPVSCLRNRSPSSSARPRPPEFFALRFCSLPPSQPQNKRSGERTLEALLRPFCDCVMDVEDSSGREITSAQLSFDPPLESDIRGDC
jgi:hypothetical protein